MLPLLSVVTLDLHRLYELPLPDAVRVRGSLAGKPLPFIRLNVSEFAEVDSLMVRLAPDDTVSVAGVGKFTPSDAPIWCDPALRPLGVKVAVNEPSPATVTGEGLIPDVWAVPSTEIVTVFPAWKPLPVILTGTLEPV
jgi:hypothetical protein